MRKIYNILTATSLFAATAGVTILRYAIPANSAIQGTFISSERKWSEPFTDMNSCIRRARTFVETLPEASEETGAACGDWEKKFVTIVTRPDKTKDPETRTLCFQKPCI